MHRPTALLAALLLFAPGNYAQVEPGQSFTGKVTSVIDGDTYDGDMCKVDRPAGPVVKVRLWGVGAPEFDRSYGVNITSRCFSVSRLTRIAKVYGRPFRKAAGSRPGRRPRRAA
jgi:hypothetical protein